MGFRGKLNIYSQVFTNLTLVFIWSNVGTKRRNLFIWKYIYIHYGFNFGLSILVTG